jgi:hypothetical protein
MEVTAMNASVSASDPTDVGLAEAMAKAQVAPLWNGAAQAIIDAATLARILAAGDDPVSALKACEAERLGVTAKFVLANGDIAPDAILRVVEERTRGKPFKRIDDVISRDELVEWQERDRKVAGFASDDLKLSRALA